MVVIERFAYLPFGTFGHLFAPEFSCYTVERPWLENKAWTSCIPCGTYQFAPDEWFSHGSMPVIGINNVANRSRILIHPGNFPRNVQGCVAVGDDLRCINGELGVTNSRKTFTKLMRVLSECSGDISFTNVMGGFV